MFKFIVIFALVAVASAAPGYFTENHHAVVQPAVLAKTAVIDNSASSAITHQSFTNLEKKVPVVHTYAAAPVLKTVAATPVEHTYETAPILKTVAAAPVLHSYETAPILKTVAAAPVVHSYETVAAAPLAHTYAAAPVVHYVPVVKTFLASPVAYHSYH